MLIKKSKQDLHTKVYGLSVGIFSFFSSECPSEKKEENSLKFKETQRKRIILEKFVTKLKFEKMKRLFQVSENSQYFSQFSKNSQFFKEKYPMDLFHFSVFEYIRE